VIIGILAIALIVVAFGVIVQSKKRKGKGITWFPEGFVAHGPPQTQP